MGEPIFLQDVRVSFPHLKAPHAAKQNTTPKYQIDLIMAPNHPGWLEIMKRVPELASARYGDHAAQMLDIINKDRAKRCYGWGTDKVNKKTMQPFDGYADNVYVAVKNANRPTLYKSDGTQVDPANDMAYMDAAGKIYGGCYVNAAIDLYTSKGNDGIFGGLIAVQFLRDGESFGDGAPDVSGMFGAVPGATPAGMPAPNATPQPSTNTPAPGMPDAPFAPPGMPSFMPPGE
jgi:hypothetical protein